MSARLPAAVATVLLAGPAGACDALLVDPAPAGTEVAISFSVSQIETAGPAHAFSLVDRAYLRFSTGDTVKRDTVLAVTHGDQGARVRLALRTDEQVPALGIYAELRTAESVLFKGLEIVRIEPGVPTSTEVQLLPVPAILRPSVGELAVPFVGDTVRLSSAVLFASGDTIPGLAGQWSSENPEVASVSPTGLVLGRAVGETRLSVTFQTLVAHVPVVVVAPR